MRVCSEIKALRTQPANNRRLLLLMCDTFCTYFCGASSGVIGFPAWTAWCGIYRNSG